MGKEALEVAAKASGADKANGQDASPLRAEMDSALASPPKPNDKTKVADKPFETPQPSGEPNDPYTHTNRIRLRNAQLDQLSAEGKKPDDVITVDNKQVKVKDFVKEAKAEIKLELEQAKTAAKAINMTTVGVMINHNIQEKNTLSLELGLDPKLVSPEVLQAERAKAANNPDRRNKIDQLDVNLQERAAMEAVRHAPAYVKLVEAEVTAKGFARPELALNQEVSQDDTRKAFELLKLAGNEDAELKASEIYSNIETVVGMTFASHQQERSQKIIELMRSATEAGKRGEKQTVTIEGETKTLSQEELLKEANKLADKINVPWIASQAMLKRNQENGAATELMNIVSIASFARLDYVNYMSTHGQVKEAQTLFTKVKADTPHLIYNQDGTYRDESLKTLDTKLTLGINTEGTDYEMARTNFLHAIEKGNVNPDPRKPGQSATEYLDQMRTFNAQHKKEMQEANKVLETDKQNLLKRQQEMEKKSPSSRSDAENVELNELQRQIKIIDQTLEQRKAYFDRRENLNTYMEGTWYEAKEDYDAARGKYQEFNAKETDEKLKEALQIDQKMKRTQEGFSGWFHRNKGAIAIGASVLLAAGATVVTFGAAGAAGFGLVAATAAAVGAGTAGGAIGYWGVDRIGNPDAGLDSLWKGAKIGLATSSMIVAPWASGARVAATGGIAQVGNAAASTTAIGRALGFARTVGITKNTLMAGTGVSAVTNGGDYAFGYKTGTEAATHFVRDGLFNAALIGQAGKWGVVSETALAANAGKTTLKSALGLSTTNAAAGYSVAGIMEGYNYASGSKSGGEALRDFTVGGAANTLTLSVLRKYGLSNDVGRMATTNLQSTRYAAQAVLLNESFGATSDILGTKFIAHDLMGQPAFASETNPDTRHFLSPLAHDFYRQNFTNGLNILHSGERKRFISNLDFLGNDMTSVVGVDKKYVQPWLINQTGIFDEPLPQNDQR